MSTGSFSVQILNAAGQYKQLRVFSIAWMGRDRALQCAVTLASHSESPAIVEEFAGDGRTSQGIVYNNGR